jgi:cereblon
MCFFICKRCRNKIAIYNDIFAMSKDSVNANYCNPAGYIHETLTVTKTLDGAVRMVDRASVEFSWFPGYAWQIAICSNCQTHVGWRFIAVVNKNLRPRVFFGLSCKSLLVNAENDEDEQRQEQSSTDDSV